MWYFSWSFCFSRPRNPLPGNSLLWQKTSDPRWSNVDPEGFGFRDFDRLKKKNSRILHLDVILRLSIFDEFLMSCRKRKSIFQTIALWYYFTFSLSNSIFLRDSLKNNFKFWGHIYQLNTIQLLLTDKPSIFKNCLFLFFSFSGYSIFEIFILEWYFHHARVHSYSPVLCVHDAAL